MKHSLKARVCSRFLDSSFGFSVSFHLIMKAAQKMYLAVGVL